MVDNPIASLKADLKFLTDRVIAQGFAIDQLSISLFRAHGMTKSQFDEQSKNIRDNFGVTDVMDPNAIKAAAQTDGVRKHLDQIFAAMRRQLPD
ncbi:hypothetical protein [Sphingobium aromaticiconvertens]|uniref:hypothetical protein n=1 Tax=Sphingobium aromaticiconvertens TaxID=365341 RepID=UPI0030180028